MKSLRFLAAGPLLLFTCGFARGDALDPEAWPRTYQLPEAEIAIYMPQILEWPGFLHLKANAAIGVKMKGHGEAAFGAVVIEADTVTDFEEDRVRLGKRSFSRFRFPELDEASSKEAEELVRSILRPGSPLELPLASVTSALERSASSAGETAASFDPPPIHFSDSPAVLVTFIGRPLFEPVAADPSLTFAVNTNWDILFDGSKYHLLAGDRWLVTGDVIEGPWTAATSLPASFATLPDDGNWSEVKSKLSVAPGSSPAPRAFSSDRPAEIIVTEGKPRLSPIPSTSLMQVTTTESDLFFHPAGKTWYLLLAGRWFSFASLGGPWISAGETLPDDFASIPPQSPKYNVTHVHVYHSDADTVEVGVTSGYHGAYVARGVVVFGLGMWLGHELAENSHPHYHPVPFWYGYGCGAVYFPGHGYHRCGAVHYGPYGGAGFAAGYNPVTGRFTRAALAYGPYRSAGIRTAYNPWTNTAAGRVSVSTPYGSWGRSVVKRDDEWIRAAHRSTPTGTIAGIETSRGGGVVAIERKYGPDGFVGKTADGDVYVGRDGNIYRRDEDGGWQKRENGDWQDAPDMRPRRPEPETMPARGNDRISRPERPPFDPAQRNETNDRPATRREPADRNPESVSSRLGRDSDSRRKSVAPRGGASNRRR